MIEGQKVIYTARTMQDAHLLKNLLADQRIQAIVLNEALPGGSGGDLVGWATAARVVVAEKDAVRARQIAVKFDRKMASSPGKLEGVQLPQEPPIVLEHWPRCPECDAPRLTRCPICGTAGSHFPQADTGFLGLPESDEAARPSAGCGCGPGGCTPSGAAAEPVPDDAHRLATDEAEPEVPETMLICTTCDEPFEPEYPRRCEWCGHQFPDGLDVDVPQVEVEHISARAVAVIIGLLAVAIALVAYFMLIVQGS